jgi:hypothetical protein
MSAASTMSPMASGTRKLQSSVSGVASTARPVSPGSGKVMTAVAARSSSPLTRRSSARHGPSGKLWSRAIRTGPDSPGPSVVRARPGTGRPTARPAPR